MIDISEFKIQCQGRWPGVLGYLGIDIGDGKHKACPACGGSDRFRFDDKDGSGSYFCNGCGAGDGIGLVQKTLGITFPEAIKRISDALGIVEFMPSKKEKKEYDIRSMLNGIWKCSKKLGPSDLVSKYLRGRGLVLEPENVRFCQKCYESDGKCDLPAMVALVSDKDSIPVAIHRTYLNGDKKAEIVSPKKTTPAIKPLRGCSVKLFKITDTVGIAEGIETAIAAAQLWNIPTWSALSTSVLESFDPPVSVKKIVIFGDNDSNFAGQKSAYTLANKLVLKDFIVEVQIPEFIGDWNDEVLRYRKEIAAGAVKGV